METNIHIIEALAGGINPLTGEVLPNDSLYNDPEIIRALFTTLEQIKNPKSQARVKKTAEQKQAENLENGLPVNAGLPWSEEHRMNVAERFKAGELVSDLATAFGRTHGSITAELKKQGLIEY